MTHPDEPALPLALERPEALAGRRLFRKRWLLVLPIPVHMFSGAVIGLYFQPPALRAFYAATGLRPGGGASVPIALPPDVELPKEMAETMRPSDVLGLARLMPRGDLSPVAAPYGAGDARLADILVAEGDRVEKGTVVARLDNHDFLQSAILQAEAALAIREAALMQTRAAVQSSRDEAQATLDQMRRRHRRHGAAPAQRGAVRPRRRDAGHAGRRAGGRRWPPSPRPRRRWPDIPPSHWTTSRMWWWRCATVRRHRPTSTARGATSVGRWFWRRSRARCWTSPPPPVRAHPPRASC